MSKVDWKELENEYVCGEMSYRALANKHKIAPSRVSAVGKKQNWVKKRDKYRSNVAQVTLQNARATDIKNKLRQQIGLPLSLKKHLTTRSSCTGKYSEHQAAQRRLELPRNSIQER